MYPKVFYSVCGTNGLGVFTNYEKLMESKTYLREFKCKKHKTYLDAKTYAIQLFNDLQENSCLQIQPKTDVKMSYNWVQFRKDIRRK